MNHINYIRLYATFGPTSGPSSWGYADDTNDVDTTYVRIPSNIIQERISPAILPMGFYDYAMILTTCTIALACAPNRSRYLTSRPNVTTSMVSTFPHSSLVSTFPHSSLFILTTILSPPNDLDASSTWLYLSLCSSPWFQLHCSLGYSKDLYTAPSFTSSTCLRLFSNTTSFQ
jgi:hypothetical protein